MTQLTVDAVFAACAAHDVAVEINSRPERQDPPDDLIQVALEAGWYVSFSGIITFKKWDDLALLRLVPEDRLLLESDSPYLAPVPNRGKRNEPAWCAYTLQRLAEVRAVEVHTLGAAVVRNTQRVFALR